MSFITLLISTFGFKQSLKSIAKYQFPAVVPTIQVSETAQLIEEVKIRSKGPTSFCPRDPGEPQTPVRSVRSPCSHPPHTTPLSCPGNSSGCWVVIWKVRTALEPAPGLAWPGKQEVASLADANDSSNHHFPSSPIGGTALCHFSPFILYFGNFLLRYLFCIRCRELT